MSTESNEGKSDKTRSGPATGYATGKRNTTIADLRALVRSQNHYVQHWRSRAERAEADCAALREEREELIRIKNAAYRDYCCNGDLADGPICSLYGLWSVFGKSHNEVAHPRGEQKGQR